MKKYWQAIGITAVAVGILYYPALKLYQYLQKRGKSSKGEEGKTHYVKAFMPAFRGKRKHHRSEHNGHSDPGLGLA